MADRKEWKEQLLSKLLDQYEKSVTYVGENKVKQDGFHPDRECHRPPDT